MTEPVRYVRLCCRDPLEISEGPGPLPRVFRNIAGFDKLAPEELARHGWYPFRAERPEFPGGKTHKEVWRLSLEGGEVVSRAALVKLNPAEAIHRAGEHRRELLARLPGVRFRHETGGIVFEGIPLHTDRESQATLALTALQGSAERWKGSDGKWYDMPPERLQAAAQAVITHKRACFAHEEALEDEIRRANGLEALLAIDLEEGWP